MLAHNHKLICWLSARLELPPQEVRETLNLIPKDEQKKYRLLHEWREMFGKYR